MNPFETAEEKFGSERAEQLRRELEQLVADLEKLHSVPLDIDDAP